MAPGECAEGRHHEHRLTQPEAPQSGRIMPGTQTDDGMPVPAYAHESVRGFLRFMTELKLLQTLRLRPFTDFTASR